MTKEIKWQFVEGYYNHLINKIKHIDYYLQMERYDLAFTEMQQIYIQINNAIAERQKDKLEKLESMYSELLAHINEYELSKLKLKPGKKSMIKITKQKHIVKTMTNEYYKQIMATLDQLNMFFPKGRKMPDLPIYQ